MITLLEKYISHLGSVDMQPDTSYDTRESYNMPVDNVSPHEWAEFEHVYQIHFPCIFMDKAVRDVWFYNLFI